jgi:hypothetical protein
MAKIITKYSTTGGLSPSGLTTGELAVNILDKKLYVGGAAGPVSLSDSYVNSFNGRTGAVQGVSAANGLTGAVTWAAGTGLDVSSGGGAITYGIGAGFALLRSVGNTAALDTILNPSVGDLVFVQDRGTYYYWDYYALGATLAWINISLISNALQGDLNGDGSVNGADLGILLNGWGSVYGNRSLNIGIKDGITGAFKIFADGSGNPKKQEMVVVSTEGLTSEFRVNTDNIYLTGLVEIDGEDTGKVALTVYNGKTELYGDTTVNGTLQLLNGGISGGFIDGGTFV